MTSGILSLNRCNDNYRFPFFQLYLNQLRYSLTDIGKDEIVTHLLRVFCKYKGQMTLFRSSVELVLPFLFYIDLNGIILTNCNKTCKCVICKIAVPSFKQKVQ